MYISCDLEYAVSIDFSIVIPAYNEALYLEPTLQSIREQHFGGELELIVVDNNSTDDTCAIARRYADVILHYSERQGAAAARQYGARRSRGRNLVFLDADTEMSPHLLRLAARSLEAGYVGGSAPIRISDDSFGATWTEFAVNNWHRFIGPTFIPYLYCSRDVFLRAGGWDQEVTCGEEVRLQRRLQQHGKLAWDSSGCTTTDARRYKSEGYVVLALKGVSAQFFGVNHAWRPVREFPSVTSRDVSAAQ